MKFLISYDLEQPPAARDYEPLMNRLREHGAHRVLYSEWVLETNWTHTQIRDDLKRFMLPHDRILVVTIAAPAAWNNLLMTDQDFLGFMR